jgi:hypothetical protein
MKNQRDYIQGEILQPVEVVNYGPVNATAKQVRYNLQKIEATEDKPASVEFDCVNVEELTKKDLKVAIIRKHYDINDEIALQQKQDTPEWEAYQLVRLQADEVWNNIQA